MKTSTETPETREAHLAAWKAAGLPAKTAGRILYSIRRIVELYRGSEEEFQQTFPALHDALQQTEDELLAAAGDEGEP